MTKVFVIVASEGEYSDTTYNTLAVCKSLAKAEQLVKDLNRLSNWKNQQRKALNTKVEKYREKLQAEYNIPDRPVKPEVRDYPQYKTNLAKWDKEFIVPFKNMLQEWNNKWIPVTLKLREKVNAFEAEEINKFLNAIDPSDNEIIQEYIPGFHYQDPYFEIEEVNFVE